MKYPESLVFGLDIGTRSIVGTVGYKVADKFHVVAQRAIEHETRAMLDGQIHDIGKVGETIKRVKEELENVIGQKLEDVCIAAAGRVLRTVTVNVEEEFTNERSVTEEDIFALNTLGIEKAYNQFNESASEADSELNFYCVGYSVIRYYLNGYPMGNLENHNAKKIAADLIATFLPDDVVDGLYKAVAIAGLNVSNITLEPIAAISLAIPEMYRMLNIALVDVGAGTSDISITRDGTIIAFGMIPIAGDAITETICQHCLVDFNTADKIKKDAETEDDIQYLDIIGLSQHIKAEDVCAAAKPVIENMTKQVADKIKELNGDKSVSAVFVVGGGGRINGYTQSLAEKLDILPERVAIRGREVMNNIVFHNEDLTIDSLLVTPIGICLSYYEQNNSFIYVSFNGRSVKLYDNGKATVIDAAMQAQFSNEDLFPKRGTALHYTVNGIARMARGNAGESAVVMVNGVNGDIHSPIKDKDQIKVIESTAGDPATMTIGQIPEYGATMDIFVNSQLITLPKFAEVNGELQSEYYDIKSGDDIHMLDYYTVKQITEFMDVILNPTMNVYVNNKKADMDTPVYANFEVIWTLEVLNLEDTSTTQEFANLPDADENQEYNRPTSSPAYETAYADMSNADYSDDLDTLLNEDVQDQTVDDKENSGSDLGEQTSSLDAMSNVSEENSKLNTAGTDNISEPEKTIHDLRVIVNGSPIVLSGKKEYVFVDVFEYINFDLSKPQGASIITKLNGRDAQYMEELHPSDIIDIHWED